jgi:ketosteroid isomerase-like protein
VSSEDVEIVRQALAAWDTHDVEALVKLSAAEVEVVPFRAALEDTVWRGHEGVRRWYESRTDDTWEDIAFAPRQFCDLGDQVLVVGELHATGRLSTADLVSDAARLFAFAEGRIVRVHSYGDVSEARRVVGLAD